MKKGIIMDIDESFLTLLTPEGEFLRAPKQNHSYTIGEEIRFSPIENQKSKNFFSLNRLFNLKPLPVVFAAVLLLFGMFVPMYQNNQAYAYMSIDVNPSLELGVNKKMEVVKLTAFNPDGKKIISHLDDWKKTEVSKLTQSILDEMQKQGYLKENHVILISTVRTEKQEKEAEEKLTKNMKKIKEEVKETQLQLTVLTGTEKEMEKAHHLGITTGKYQESKMNRSIDQKRNGPSPRQDQQETKIKKTIPQAGQHKEQLNEGKRPNIEKAPIKNRVKNPHESNWKKKAPNQNHDIREKTIKEINHNDEKEEFSHSNNLWKSKENDDKKMKHNELGHGHGHEHKSH